MTKERLKRATDILGNARVYRATIYSMLCGLRPILKFRKTGFEQPFERNAEKGTLEWKRNF